MGTRPKATTNMNLSTIASLVLLAAVGSVAYPNYEDSVVPYEDFAQAPEMVQYAPQQGFVATEAEVSAAMSMRIEYDFKGHSDAERYFSAGMVRDPEFVQTMMRWGAVGNAAKAVGGAVVKGAKWVGSKVMAGAKLVCPKAVAFAQSKAHALISAGGNLCKTALCPAIVTYVVGQTG